MSEMDIFISEMDKQEEDMEHYKLPHDHGNGFSAEYLHAELSGTGRFDEVAELFRQLSDPTRIRILWLLSHHEECVINISSLLDMTSPAISHHLRILKDCGIVESRRDGKEVYYRIADTEECRLLHHIIEEVMEISCPTHKEGYQESQKDIIAKVHDYLMDDLSKRVTIEELSKMFLINPTTLKQTFKEVYGTSVAAHVNAHRMKKAAHLLASTQDSIASIAKQVGFAGQSRFTASFKHYFGILPTEYRSLHTNDAHYAQECTE